MRTPLILLSVSLVACGGAQKGVYKPGAGADVRCFEGTRVLSATNKYPMVLKLVFDPANKKVAEIYTDRDHSQNNFAPYDMTYVYSVGADGSATASGGRTAKFTTGEPWKWTGWTTHSETHSADFNEVAERTATLAGDSLTYAESTKSTLAGLDTSGTSNDSFTQFDCAQYDAKRQALPAGGKK